MLDARSLARALGGDVIGPNRVNVPGPGHSRKDRSLTITLTPTAPDGFLVKSRCGDDDLACKDFVRAALGLPAWSPRSGAEPRPVHSLARVSDEDEKRRAEWVQARVDEIWGCARDPRGTIVEKYLIESRELELPEEVAGSVIRFDPACPWKDESGSTIRVPAMIAAMRSVSDDKLTAVHRTRLTPDGRKVDRRMFGAAKGSAIKLDSDENVTMGVVVGEGLETCLAAWLVGLRPVWAVASAGAIASFPALSGVDAITLLAEDDATGANARAVEECGARWHAAGKGVLVAASKYGGDINDAVKGRAA